LGDTLSTTDKARLLRSVPLLSDVSDQYLLALARHGRDIRAQAGDVLLREGDAGGELMLLLEGNAEVRKGETKINDLHPGDYFGELSLLDGQPRSADVVASAPTRVMTVDHVAFEAIMSSEPSLAPKIVQNLVRMIRGGETGQSPG
jgi:CRP-like cAMP-binding protein